MTAPRPLPTAVDARLLAGHVAFALAAHRERLRDQRHPLPVGLVDLEAVFLAWSRSAQGPAHGPASAPVPRALLTFEEVAEALAVSSKTVGRLVATGDLSAVGVGRARRVRVVDLDTFLATLGRDRSGPEGPGEDNP